MEPRVPSMVRSHSSASDEDKLIRIRGTTMRKVKMPEGAIVEVEDSELVLEVCAMQLMLSPALLLYNCLASVWNISVICSIDLLLGLVGFRKQYS
jgi:hypothetical protein